MTATRSAPQVAPRPRPPVVESLGSLAALSPLARRVLRSMR